MDLKDSETAGTFTWDPDGAQERQMKKQRGVGGPPERLSPD